MLNLIELKCDIWSLFNTISRFLNHKNTGKSNETSKGSYFPINNVKSSVDTFLAQLIDNDASKPDNYIFPNVQVRQTTH